MHRTLCLLVFLGLLTPSASVAQHWNAQEQELVDHIKRCWTAWIEARPEETPEAFFQQCPYAEDASMWWTEFGAPQTPERIRREWGYARRVDLDWIDLNPLAVRVWGDVGMIQYYGLWKAQGPEGIVTTEYKRTEIFRKVEGRWVFQGGQGLPPRPGMRNRTDNVRNVHS